MIDGSSIDLVTHPDARQVTKRPVPLAVTFADRARTIPTREGDVRCTAGDAIVTGVGGERWPIPKQKFEQTYEPLPPTCMGRPGHYRKRPLKVWALQMDVPFFVEVSWGGGRLEGKPGDWLLQYGPKDYGVVSADVFAATYREETA